MDSSRKDHIRTGNTQIKLEGWRYFAAAPLFSSLQKDLIYSMLMSERNHSHEERSNMTLC